MDKCYKFIEKSDSVFTFSYFCLRFYKKEVMLQFIKNWTLPLAMLAGVIGYFFFSSFGWTDPVKPAVRQLMAWLTPILIFLQLFLTFCKVEVKDLSPRPWVWWLLSFQLLSCLAVSAVLIVGVTDSYLRILLEGVMVCLICPTATAAAVVTGKLGGSAAALTTYTLLSNLLAAVAVPLLFPLIEASDISFLMAFSRILSKVFPLLLLPFVMAWLCRRWLPVLHRWVVARKDLAFYLWAVALVIVMGQTTESVIEGDTSLTQECGIAFLALLACVIQFVVGKQVGGMYADRISAGQALGQKNTVLAIWMACTYLNPASAIAPGSYVLWQNVINSWQLWKKRVKDSREAKA